MKVIIADFETTPFDYTAVENYFLHSRFVCFKDITNNKKYFFNIEKDGKEIVKEFILSQCSLKNPCRFYFHNLRFDIAFFFELLPSNEYNYRVVRSGSKIIQFRVFKEYETKMKNGKIRKMRKTLLEIRDSLVLLLSSIEKIGKSLGFPKLDIDYNMKEITVEYIEYCYRDIEVIEKAFEKVIEFYDKFYNYKLTISNLPLTLPALSKRVFHYLLVNKYGKNILNQIYDKYSLDYESRIREFYYGGRVEVFDFNPCYNGYYNDFNSHYPAVMRENKFPLAPYKFYKCSDSDKCFTTWKNNKNIFACICNVYENLDIPLIATKVNNKLVFAKGKKYCLLFRKEIEYLLSLNQKIEILEIITCTGYLDIFSEFIHIAYYKIKKQYSDDSFEYWYSKIKMNSLYGKFAEKREKEKIEIINDLSGLSEIELNQCSFTDNGIMKVSTSTYNTIKVNIFYSMMITALARLKLHKEIMKSSKPYYCDSDSIVSVDLIENSDKLGHLSPEFIFSKYQALGCKEYIYQKWITRKNPIINVPLKQNTIKMKGFGKLDDSNFDLFISQFFKPKKQNRMIGFMESFHRDLPLNLVLVFDKMKTFVYDKRWILKDLTTRAFDLEKDDFDDMILNNKNKILEIVSKYQNKQNLLLKPKFNTIKNF